MRSDMEIRQDTEWKFYNAFFIEGKFGIPYEDRVGVMDQSFAILIGLADPVEL